MKKIVIMREGFMRGLLGKCYFFFVFSYSFLIFFSFSFLLSYAKDLGVEISVVTMEGTHCSMENIGMLADKTGGNVDIVNPVELAKNFHNILEETAIATNVSLKLVMHNNLFLRFFYFCFCFCFCFLL